MVGTEGSKHPVGKQAQTSQDTAQAPSFSCVVCHKRKVKCNRKDPCSNCEKAGIECIYRPPPPPRRRKRVHSLNGDAFETQGKSRRQENEAPTQLNSHHRDVPSLSRIQSEQEGKGMGSGRMIMKDGNSVFIDK